MKKLLCLLPICVLLAACQEEVRTVEYYVEHEKERSRVVSECGNEGRDDRNCKNARAAVLKSSAESESMPSI